MLNQEAVINAIAVPGYNEGAVEKAIIDYGINPTDSYAPESSLIVNKAALQVLKAMLAVARVQEGDYTLEYSIDGIQARIADLQGEIGIISVSQPQIRNASYRW